MPRAGTSDVRLLLFKTAGYEALVVASSELTALKPDFIQYYGGNSQA
jgi:hypothetical protein